MTVKRIRKTVYGKTQKEALDKIDDLKQQAKLNMKAIVARESLAAYLTWWLANDVAVSRLYKDGDNWKDSNSFGRDDLPIVAKVVDRCHTWIFSENGSATVSDSDEGGDSTPF